MMASLRREYRLTAEEIATQLKLTRSTVAAWLKRRGLGRLKSLDEPAPVVRYQRQRPGELLHLDVKKLARFERVGHRITGDRRWPLSTLPPKTRAITSSKFRPHGLGLWRLLFRPLKVIAGRFPGV